MVADNSDEAGNFSDSLTQIHAAAANLPATRVELDSQSLAEARSALIGGLNSGATWLSYSGHGGLDRLAAEGLLTVYDLPTLSSTGQLPIVSALTCSINRFEIPGYTSLGEALVLDDDGGAIAVLAPSGLSQNSWATELGEKVMGEALVGSSTTLGEAILEGFRGISTRNAHRATYTLFGDPALVLDDKSSEQQILFSSGFELGDTSAWN